MKDREIVQGKINSAGGVTWDMDASPEFIIDLDDERYIECLKLAHQLKKEYPLDKIAATDKVKIAEYEEAITTKLVAKIHEQFGDYNEHIAAGKSSKTHPTLHGDYDRQNTDNPTHLKEFKTGELICRHFAPLARELGEEAGCNFFTISGQYHTFERKGDKMEPLKDISGQSASHLYVVSGRTGNVIEATGQSEFAYKRNVNGLSIADIMAGKTIITQSPSYSDRLSTYGSFFSGETEQEEILKQRKKLIEQGRLDNLPSYDPYKDSRAQGDFDKARIKLNKKALVYDSMLVQDFDARIVAPLKTRFETAVKEGDIETAGDCCRQRILNKSTLEKGILTALEDGNVKLARSLTKQGVEVDASAMAEQLKKAIQSQNLALAEFAIDKRALEGFSNKVNVHNLPFWFKLTEKPEKFDREFMLGMNKKLGVSPMDYFNHAVESRWPQHVEAALEGIHREGPITAEMKEKFVKAAKELKRNRYLDAAQTIDDFVAREFDAPVQVAKTEDPQIGNVKIAKAETAGATGSPAVVAPSGSIMPDPAFNGVGRQGLDLKPSAIVAAAGTLSRQKSTVTPSTLTLPSENMPSGGFSQDVQIARTETDLTVTIPSALSPPSNPILPEPQIIARQELQMEPAISAPATPFIPRKSINPISSTLATTDPASSTLSLPSLDWISGLGAALSSAAASIPKPASKKPVEPIKREEPPIEPVPTPTPITGTEDQPLPRTPTKTADTSFTGPLLFAAAGALIGGVISFFSGASLLTSIVLALGGVALGSIVALGWDNATQKNGLTAATSPNIANAPAKGNTPSQERAAAPETDALSLGTLKPNGPIGKPLVATQIG